MRKLIAVMLLAAWGISYAASSSEIPLPKASAPQQSTSANQRGTEQSPLVININAVPKPSAEERAEKAAERQQQAETDGWLVNLTAGLVVATVLLVIATGLLWVSTKKLATETAESSKRQSMDTQAALEISRNQFIAANRPEIIIHRVYLKEDAEHLFFASVEYTNVGGTPANIQEIKGTIFQSDDLENSDPPLRLITANHIVLGSGMKDVFDCYPPPVDPLKMSGNPRWLVGTITYTDGVGNRREMGFARVLVNMPKRHWAVVNHKSQHDYAY